LRYKPNSNPDKYIFSKFISKNDTVIDIGANIGLYTNFFRELVGRNGFVHSFEPIPNTFRKLEYSTKKYSPIDNYKLNMIGLHSKEVISNAFIPNQISGHASIANHSKIWKTNFIEKVEIGLTTLDKYYEVNNFKNVNFIKIDIEGSEYNALKGSKQVINQHKPTLCIEVNSDLMNYYKKGPTDLIKFLKILNYKNIYYYDELPWKLRKFEHLVNHSKNINTNIIAIP